jgi:ribulose bisphosphate carboxylase small subunit
MGHERIGFLPRSQQWLKIVNELAIYNGDIDSVKQITESTLHAIRKNYEEMPLDESIIKAISFLATISFSAKQTDQIDYLISHGYIIDTNISLYSLMSSAQNLITTNKDSLEINKIAKDAAMQALIDYQREHSLNQLSLFGDETTNIWKSVGTGAAFCELTRSFFAAFTERQLKYYLNRAAASSIGDYSKLQSFSRQISEHVQEISNHAFDISKITQSFAAGWFNKHAKTVLPSKKKVIGLLKLSFKKLQEEFRREGNQ